MRSLMVSALEDNVITSAEELDIEEVRRILGLSAKDSVRIMCEAQQVHASQVGSCEDLAPTRSELTGKTICFTGTLACRIEGKQASRRMAEEKSKAVGMVVKKNVSKSLNFLVVADPDTMSGKAKQARILGTRIIAEPVFWRLVGVSIE